MRAFRAVAILLGLAFAASASSDGGYFGQSANARPLIPDQRAFIAFRNGKETIIVESQLKAPAGEYAWVIPLPATPKVAVAGAAGWWRYASISTVQIAARSPSQAAEMPDLTYYLVERVLPCAEDRGIASEQKLRELAKIGVTSLVQGFQCSRSANGFEVSLRDAQGVRLLFHVAKRLTPEDVLRIAMRAEPGDRPGGYKLKRTASGYLLTLFDGDGTPHGHALSKDFTDAPGSIEY